MSVDEPDFTQAPTLQNIVSLARQLAHDLLPNPDEFQLFVDEQELGDFTEKLWALKLGVLPEDLPEHLRKAVNGFEEEWASESGLGKLQEVVGRVLRPLLQGEDEVRRVEAELALEQERLAAFSVLADLLDELLQSQPDAQVKA